MAYSTDPTLWLYTSLSSGSSHIVTATSRMETILKANKIPFKATDVATDEKARMLWGRRAGKRKLPGLVRMGMVLADLDEVEEWNEYGEIQENLGPEKPPAPAKPTSVVPSSPPSSSAGPPAPPPLELKKDPSTSDASSSKPPSGSGLAKSPGPESDPKSPSNLVSPLAATIQQIGFEAAEKASKAKSKLRGPISSTSAKTEADSSSSKTETDSGPAKEPEAATTDTATESNPSESDDKVENSADEPLTKDANSDNAKADAEEPKADAEGAESPLPGPTPAAETSEKVDVADKTEASAQSPTQPPGKEIARHRGSSISAASPDEIKEIEEASKIQEEPEAEAEEAVAVVEEPIEEVKAESVQPAEDAPKPEPAGAQSTAVAADDNVEETDGELQKKAEAKRQAEPHIKFVGETPGQEIDRVKAVLGGKKVAESASKNASAESSSGVAAKDAMEALPGTRTQDQEAGDASKAGESVAD